VEKVFIVDGGLGGKREIGAPVDGQSDKIQWDLDD
jgi:hypothetical protein